VVVLAGVSAVALACVLAEWRYFFSTPPAVYITNEEPRQQSPQALTAPLPPLAEPGASSSPVQAVYVGRSGDPERKLAYVREYAQDAPQPMAGQATVGRVPANFDPVTTRNPQPLPPGVPGGPARVLIKEPGGAWVDQDSPAGQSILERVRAQCAQEHWDVLTGPPPQ